MKTIFRLAMAVLVATLFLWGGVAGAAEPALEPGSYEYLVALETGNHPFESVPSNALAELKAPEVGTWEYSHALETGSLPAMCGDMPCEAEGFTIIESGGILFRVPVDVGG